MDQVRNLGEDHKKGGECRGEIIPEDCLRTRCEIR